jgi:hypothetical protein
MIDGNINSETSTKGRNENENYCLLGCHTFEVWRMGKVSKGNTVFVFRTEYVLRSSESLNQREMLCTFNCLTRL